MNIMRNAIWLGFGEVASHALLFVLLVFAARALGAHGYGVFSFGLSLATLFIVLAKFGLPTVVVREFARNHAWSSVFPSIFTLGIVLSLGAFLLFGGAGLFLSQEPFMRLLFFFFAGYVVATTLLELLYAFFHSREEMRYEAVVKVLQAGAVAGFGVLVLLQKPFAHYLALVYAAGALGALVLMGGIFWRRISSLRLRVDVAIWKTALSRSWPLGIVGLFTFVSNNIDSVMLGLFGQITEAGWYNAAYRLMGIALIPTVFLGHSFLPALSKRVREAGTALQAVWERQLETALALGVPATIGVAMAAPILVQALYTPEFEPAIFALQLLAFAVAPTFLFSASFVMLLAAGMQKKIFWLVGAGALANVLLNLWLIPAYSLYGAAAATVATSVLLLFFYGFAVLRHTSVRVYTHSIGRIVLRVGGATGVMAGVLLWVSPASLPLMIGLGVAVYAVSYGAIRRILL